MPAETVTASQDSTLDSTRAHSAVAMTGISIVSIIIVVVAMAVANAAGARQRASKVPLPAHATDGTFPDGFQFGISTSSYQVEGGWIEGGKGMSTWDAYSHTPGMINHGDTGDIANDMYHLYPDDIKLMAAFGLKNYRFSIAWNRILPTGIAPINPTGIAYYSDLIDQLIAHDIEPHVTLYHSELPLALTMYPHKANPFLDAQFPTWFADYTDVLFDAFGDRVKQ